MYGLNRLFMRVDAPDQARSSSLADCIPSEMRLKPASLSCRSADTSRALSGFASVVISAAFVHAVMGKDRL